MLKLHTRSRHENKRYHRWSLCYKLASRGGITNCLNNQQAKILIVNLGSLSNLWKKAVIERNLSNEKGSGPNQRSTYEKVEGSIGSRDELRHEGSSNICCNGETTAGICRKARTFKSICHRVGCKTWKLQLYTQEALQRFGWAGLHLTTA